MARVHASLSVLMVVLVWPAWSAAQTAPAKRNTEQFRIGVEVNTVTVPVTVRGPRGSFITGLPQTAFRILEDGREQEIVAFAQEGVPLRIAFLLDTSSSVYREWAAIADSTHRFVDRMRSADRMALVTFNDEVRLRLDWGRHSDKISGVLRSIVCTGRTALWDAIRKTSRDLFDGIRERKVIILMTDGLDNTSTTKYEEMLDSAVRSETTIYVVSKTEAIRRSVLNNKNLWTKQFVQADVSLQKLAGETGGRVLYLDDVGLLNDVYREVYEELRSQYTIVYASSNGANTGKYRGIEVLVNHPEAMVSSRPGYFPVSPPSFLGHASDGPAGPEARAAAIPEVTRTLLPPAQSGGVKIGVEVNMVTVPLTVRGADGSYLKDLPQGSFRVLEDGQEQEIVAFSHEAVPARIAIVLDISGSVRDEWGMIASTTKRFASLLQSDDQFALVTFNYEARLRADWSNRVEQLDAVLRPIYCKGRTNLWDALWLVGNDVFKGVQGKKAVIVMSDGLDNGSFVSYEEMRDAAVRSGAMFYVVSKTAAVRESTYRQMRERGDYRDLPWQPFSRAEQNLRTLAEETGGRLLRPDSFGQLGAAYEEVYRELSNQYVIGYLSTKSQGNGAYRRIQVLVDRPGARVYSRPGYFPQGQPNPTSVNRQQDANEKAVTTVLPRGTTVFLRMAETITSKRRPGDIVHLEVYRDVKVGDLVVLDKGAHAWATLDTGTSGARVMGVGGNLTLDVNGAHAVTGHLVRLRASSAEHGDALPTYELARFPLLLPLALFMKGGEAVIPKGTAVRAYVDADASFDSDLVRTINSKLATRKRPDFAAAGERSVVHIYGKDYEIGMRPTFTWNSREVVPQKPAVFVDGAEIARVPENRFITVELAPGLHSFKTDRTVLELNLGEGQEVYLRLTTQGMFLPKGHLKEVSPEEGEEEMYPLAPVDKRNTRGSSETQGSAQVNPTIR